MINIEGWDPDDLKAYIWSMTGSDLSDSELQEIIAKDTKNAGLTLSRYELDEILLAIRKTEKE